MNTHEADFSQNYVRQKLVVAKDLPDTNLAVPHLKVERQLKDTNSNALTVQGALPNARQAQ